MSFSCALSLSIAGGSSGCTNRRELLDAAKKAKSTTSLTASNPESNSGTNNFLTLSQVLASNSDPAGTLDLVGDTTGQFGQYCAPTGASATDSSSSGSSSNSTTGNGSGCRCVFTYTKPNTGKTEQFETAVIYTETDLIRCKRTGIPSGVQSVKVAVKLVSADQSSNAVNFNLTYGSSNLDLSQATSYRSIVRYQCKDAVVANYLFNPSGEQFYDPFLSEDSSLSYPLNFYTSNMGGALSIYSNTNASTSGGAGWICPSKPNDSNAGMDLRLFSIQSDGGSKMIYPPVGSNSDRSTFYLAKSPTGAFNVAVNGYVAPNTLTSSPSSDGGSSSTNPPSLGYGVRPVSTGDGTEECPTSDVVIPSGYKWVKLWLFRASVADRKIPASPVVQQLSWVACNPTTFPGGGNVVTDCGGGTYPQRVIGGNKWCYDITHDGDGLTLWDRAGATSGTDLLGTGAGPTAMSSSQVQYVSLDNGLSRYDFVFVVTPTNIMTRHFKNATSESLPYTPYRYMTPADCGTTVTDPDTDATCVANATKIIRYGFKAYDVGGNGDAPQNDPARLPVFPVCTLQPI